MHQSNFSSKNDLLWVDSLFDGDSETQTTYTQTLTHAGSKGERGSLPGSENAKTHSSLKRKKKLKKIF